MRVRIIKNNSLIFKGTGSISEFIGRTYDVESQGTNGSVNINFGSIRGIMTVYKSEYEIMDKVKELDEFIRIHYPHSIYSQDLIQFILGNKVALMNILQ